MFDDIIKERVKDIIHVGPSWESTPETNGKMVKVPDSEYDIEVIFEDGEVVSRRRLK